MHRWRVGGATVVRSEAVDFAVPSDRPAADWMIPEWAPTVDRVGIAFSAIGIAVDDRRIVVDPWLADDNPRARPDADRLATKVLGDLGEAGFATDQVDTVILTHLDGIGWSTRPDGHGGWVPSFPHARYLLARAELDAVHQGQEVYGGEAALDLEAAGVVDTFDAEVTVSPSVRVIPTGGHSVGHAVVEMASEGDRMVVPGHLILSPFEVATPTRSGPAEPPSAARRRTDLLADLADDGGLLVTTLMGGSGGGRVVADGDGFALRPDHLDR